MFDKRLMKICPESRKYIIGNIVLQWLELMCNALMIYTVAQMIEQKYNLFHELPMSAFAAPLAVIARKWWHEKAQQSRYTFQNAGACKAVGRIYGSGCSHRHTGLSGGAVHTSSRRICRAERSGIWYSIGAENYLDTAGGICSSPCSAEIYRAENQSLHSLHAPCNSQGQSVQIAEETLPTPSPPYVSQ